MMTVEYIARDKFLMYDSRVVLSDHDFVFVQSRQRAKVHIGTHLLNEVANQFLESNWILRLQ